MLRRSVALLALVALSACAADPPTSTTGATFPSPPPATPQRTSGPLDAFDAKLLGAIAPHPGNFVYSPASVAFALALLRQGARGATAAEIDEALAPSAATDARMLVPRLEPTLTVANGLFVDDRAAIESGFAVVATRDFAARFESLDFHDHPDDARLRINRWASDRTHDKIRDLLAAGTVTRGTRLVLVDAIHMKAAWLTPFPRTSTKLEPFHLPGGAVKHVLTMHGHVGAKLGEHRGAAVLDVPYLPLRDGPSLSMTILLPKPGALGAVEAAYGREGIGPFIESATRTGRIDVMLPRFRVGSSADLASALRDLGVRHAFTDQADFSGISRATPLAVSAFVHNAFTEVDESGTEASATSTGGVVEITSAPIESPLLFRVDRPFLFFVRDRASGDVLFSGRVVDPSP